MEWCWSGTTTANGTVSTYNANGTTGWELALVTNPTDNTSVATNSKFVCGLHLICIMPCPSHWLLTIYFVVSFWEAQQSTGTVLSVLNAGQE